MRQVRRQCWDEGAALRAGGARLGRMLALAGGLMLVALAVLAPAGGIIPVARAHALPLRSDPAANAIVQAPPAQVRMEFSEDVNPATSRILVVDPTNREVDSRDSHVSDADSRQMLVSLPLLRAGTYVVVWRTQSADDGHVTGGSYIFRIARPDGSVPPLPAKLPSGNVPGAGGVGSADSISLDGPSLFQALFTWIALACLAFWVGGRIWETWILPPGAPRDPDLAAAARAAGVRFRALTPYALVALLVSDFGIVLAQAAEITGDWSGVFSPTLLRAILFGSRFGTFWWLRQLVAVAALTLVAYAPRHSWSPRREGAPAPTPEHAPTDTDAAPAIPDGTIPDWRRELLATVRGVRHLPRRLTSGWAALSGVGRAECTLSGALVVAFALSGHAAAVPASQFGYAVAVDLLHLLANAAWVGGLFYIGLVLAPALGTLGARSRARVLALGLPEFSALAILCATVLAASGSLTTAIHLGSLAQFVTTTYGRILFVKIELFLLMAAISAYHAFALRPRLARALAAASAEASEAAVMAPEAALVATAAGNTAAGNGRANGHVNGRAPAAAHTPARRNGGGKPSMPSLAPPAADLSRRMLDWLRREALLGMLVLFCVALLGAFAGTLGAAPAGGAAAPSSGIYLNTVAAGSYALTLKVTPAAFGTNTFLVTVKDATGAPVPGAAVTITTKMLDMDMGEQTAQLQPLGSGDPGVYSGQSDLTMAGHWQVTAKLLPPGGQNFQPAIFTFSAGY